MNVVVLISDTFRRDYLGFSGNRRIYTPQLDRLAARSVFFEQAYCASFPTVPARGDLLTGRFTLIERGWAPLPGDVPVLPQILSDAGYRTVGVVDTPFYLRRGYGYDRGFDEFRFIRGQEPGDADIAYERRYEEHHAAGMTAQAACRWLERHYREDFMLWVDMWDPHEPWDPPRHYVERYLPDWDGTCVWPAYWYTSDVETAVDDESLAYRQAMWTAWADRRAQVASPDDHVNREIGLRFRRGAPDSPVVVGRTPELVKIAEACYAGEVSMVDRAVGAVLERLETLGLMDRTMIFFLADHGFLFGEHHIFGKALLARGTHVRAPLYEEIAGVPLLVSHPDLAPRRERALVSLPDVPATILDALGLAVPATMQGRSFWPLLHGRASGHRDFTLSTMELRNPGETSRIVDDAARLVTEFTPATLTTDQWSLLLVPASSAHELYHRASDPRQQRNVAADHPDVIRRLHADYVAFLEALGTEERLLCPRRELLLPDR